MLTGTCSQLQERFVIHHLEPSGDARSFADDVRAGLSASPKCLQPKYFYDDLGSKLFEAICYLPEYYLTRAEREILARYADEIIQTIAGRARLIELGSGSAEKTRYLIDALLARQGELLYIPVDISSVSLEASGPELLKVYPCLRIDAYCGDYFAALRALATAGPGNESGDRTIALFLGSNIGNFDPQESRTFLRAVRRVLRPQDALLIGADLKKSADVLVPAYDDGLGVTAAFNLNLLTRINRELDGDFDIKKFAHRARYNDAQGRMEMHLLSCARQTVRLRAIDLDISFEEGETIHTENSYKFDLEQLRELARDTGFALEQTWSDGAHRFSFNLFTAVE